jgi:hypothetical protein
MDPEIAAIVTKGLSHMDSEIFRLFDGYLRVDSQVP